MPKIYDWEVVNEVAEFIAIESQRVLDRTNPDSHMSRKLEAHPTCETLRNGERAMATLLALNWAANRTLKDLGTMTRDPTFEEVVMEDAGIRAEARGTMTTEELMTRPDEDLGPEVAS